MSSQRLCQRGFSLLEVMIAVVILAVGVLGIAALQLTSNAYNSSSFHRSQASGLAREMIERMRANSGEARSGGYDIVSLPTGLTQDCTGTSANCSATEMRDHDLRVWSARVTDMLPAGAASISTEPAVAPAPPQITLTLQWDDSRGQRDAVSQPFVFAL